MSPSREDDALYTRGDVLCLPIATVLADLVVLLHQLRLDAANLFANFVERELQRGNDDLTRDVVLVDDLRELLLLDLLLRVNGAADVDPLVVLRREVDARCSA